MTYLAQLSSVTLQDAYPITPPPPVPTTPLKAMSFKQGIGISDATSATLTFGITNPTTAPLARVCVALPLPAWPIESTNAARFGTIKPDGWRNAAPSTNQPIRAWWVRGGGMVLSILPGGNERALLNLWPGQPFMHLWLDRTVQPGETATITVRVVESNVDVLPDDVVNMRPRYIGTAWPLGQANLDDPASPTGYKDPLSVRADKAAALIGTGVRGLQCWGQQGYLAPSYSPDMLGPMAGTGVEMMDFAITVREDWLRLGYSCRPGASIAAARTLSTIQRVTDPEPFLAQLRTAIGWGVTDLYCDSFGGYNGNVAGCLAPPELTDRDIAIGIRRELLAAGVAAPSMAELSTQATWDQMGLYVACQWTGSGFSLAGVGWDGVRRGNISLDMWRALRRANPDLHAQAQIFAPDAQRPDAIEFCGSEGIVPMVRWDQCPTFKGAIQSYIARHVDAVTGGWK